MCVLFSMMAEEAAAEEVDFAAVVVAGQHWQLPYKCLYLSLRLLISSMENYSMYAEAEAVVGEEEAAALTI